MRTEKRKVPLVYAFHPPCKFCNLKDRTYYELLKYGMGFRDTDILDLQGRLDSDVKLSKVNLSLHF